MELAYNIAKIMMNRSGGNLDLSGTGITSLPDNLTVGGSLYLRGTGITNKNVKKLHDGDYREGNYIYADGILTHIKKRKQVGNYIYFAGKIPTKNVVSDGKYYAHCANFRDGISDLLLKSAKDRGAVQYKNLPLSTEMTLEELVAMYRVITGACQQGSQMFVDNLGDKKKDRYTIQEAISLTTGQYGSERFAEFFSR